MAILSDSMKRLFHMARPSSKAIVGAHMATSKGSADGRSVVTCLFTQGRPWSE